MRWKPKLAAVVAFALSVSWVIHALTPEAGGRLIAVQFLGLCCVLFSPVMSAMAAAGVRMSRPTEIPDIVFEVLGFALIAIPVGVSFLS